MSQKQPRVSCGGGGGREGGKAGKKKAMAQDRCDMKSHRTFLGALRSIAPFGLAMQHPDIRPWRKRAEQGCCKPGYARSTRFWYDQGYIAAVRGLCSEGVLQGPDGLGSVGRTSNFAAHLGFWPLNALSSPVWPCGIKLSSPGALWLVQSLVRLAGGRRESFKIT